MKPCDHKLCSLCAYESPAARGAYAQRCPACSAYPESCVYVDVGRDTRRDIRNVVSSAADEYSKAHLPQLFLSKKYESELKSSKVHTAVSLTINTLRVQWDEQSQTNKVKLLGTLHEHIRTGERRRRLR